MNISKYIDTLMVDDSISREELKNILEDFEVKLKAEISGSRPLLPGEKVIKEIMGLSGFDMKSRKRNVTKARQIIMWFYIMYKGYSTAQAGALYGKDHATAVHAADVVENLIFTRDKVYFPIIEKFKTHMLTKKL